MTTFHSHHFLIFYILFILFQLAIVFGTDNVNRNDQMANDILRMDAHRDDLRYDEIVQATLVRSLIDTLLSRNAGFDLMSGLKLEIAMRLVPLDSITGCIILNKLESDSSFIRDCLYVEDLKRNWALIKSKHFQFYVHDNDTLAKSDIDLWDNHFERLSKTFNSNITEKIPFRIDKTEKYGRCFAPWEVRWGIRQKELNDNPHELVHIMLFKYSDVPFFHEPLAFIYGSYKGDFVEANKHFKEHERRLQGNGYISSLELFHFPQIIGLDETKWSSAFYFNYNLIKKYGIPKLLEFMKKTPWESTEDDFKENFKELYDIDLERFENGICKELIQEQN